MKVVAMCFLCSSVPWRWNPTVSQLNKKNKIGYRNRKANEQHPSPHFLKQFGEGNLKCSDTVGKGNPEQGSGVISFAMRMSGMGGKFLEL